MDCFGAALEAEPFWSSGDFTTKSAKDTKAWKISWPWFREAE
jgi:hypothetical protein